MKNYIYVFALLLAINILVPVAYSHSADAVPSGLFSFFLSSGETSSGDSTSQNELNETENTDGNSFYLYSLETKELEEIDLISFLVGSAACEVPASYEMEAIKAQMVACHSYYLYCRENGVPDDDMNLSFDERYMQKYASKERLQEYWGMGFNDNYQKFLRCANDVQNLVLEYDGKAALTPYYAVSCGKTQTSENEWGQKLDYLTVVESPDDVLSENYLKIKTFTTDEMYDRFMTAFTGFELSTEKPEEWFGDILYNESGYVTSVEVAGVKISGRDFRRYFELNSSCFMVFYEDNCFSVATKGYGHGVGLSQFGANQLSQQGKKFDEILMHYFPGTKLKNI